MLEINKITDKEFTISENGKIFRTHAVYAADFDNRLVHIYPLNGKGNVFSAQIPHILVNGETVTKDSVLNKLEFIGSFNRGGGASNTPDDEEKQRFYVLVDKNKNIYIKSDENENWKAYKNSVAADGAGVLISAKAISFDLINTILLPISSIVAHFEDIEAGEKINIKNSNFKDWGDGVLNNENNHTYALGGNYTVTVSISDLTVDDSLFGIAAKLKSVILPAGLVGMKVNAFMESGITEIDLSNTEIVEIIDATVDWHGMFRKCLNLKSVILPAGIKKIGRGAFAMDTELASITSLESVEEIGRVAFESTKSLAIDLYLPHLANIGVNAFMMSGIKSLDLTGAALKEIPDGDVGYHGAFWECLNLKSVILPAGITRIGMSAFGNTFNMESMTILATTPPERGNNAIYKSSNLKIYVPAESVDAYKSAWVDLSNYIFPI